MRQRRRGSQGLSIPVLFTVGVVLLYIVYVTYTVRKNQSTVRTHFEEDAHSAPMQALLSRSRSPLRVGSRKSPPLPLSVDTGMNEETAPLLSSCRAWRQTAGCDPKGPPEPKDDKPCSSWIRRGASGYCECAKGVRVAEVPCEHEAFTCEFMCRGGGGDEKYVPNTQITQLPQNEAQGSSSRSDGRKVDVARDGRPSSDTNCLRWRQTGRCDPNGVHEPQYDKDCEALIPDGQSGYCECSGGRRAMGVTCVHLPFTCSVMCDPTKEAVFLRMRYRKGVTRAPLRTMSEEERALNGPIQNDIPVDEDASEQEQLDRLTQGKVPARPMYDPNQLREHLAFLENKLSSIPSSPPEAQGNVEERDDDEDAVAEAVASPLPHVQQSAPMTEKPSRPMQGLHLRGHADDLVQVEAVSDEESRGMLLLRDAQPFPSSSMYSERRGHYGFANEPLEEGEDEGETNEEAPSLTGALPRRKKGHNMRRGSPW